MSTGGRGLGAERRAGHSAALISAGLLALGLFAPHRAQAGVAQFVASCMADGADLSSLPARLESQGYLEVDPAHGQFGPGVVAAAPGRRLWTTPHPGGGLIDVFTGYAPPGPGRPFQVCWHISRPGESAAEALNALKSSYPAIQGSVDTGPDAFYGGFERWQSRSGTVILGVSWPMRDQPRVGSSLLYVVRPALPG